MKINKKRLFIGLAVLAVIILACIPLVPILTTIDYQLNLEDFKLWVESLGYGGILVLFLLQMLQIIIAFIPGEFVEILAGMLYGSLGGMVICLAGILFSTTLIFFLVRRFGKKLTEKIYAKQEQKKYKFLFKTKNLYLIIFFLFLIPGTPKDILAYICPLTKIQFLPFILISTFARIPSIISSTYGGSHIIEGNFLLAAVIFSAIAIIGIIGIILHNRFIKDQA